jgi:hypothetical protein
MTNATFSAPRPDLLSIDVNPHPDLETVFADNATDTLLHTMTTEAPPCQMLLPDYYSNFHRIEVLLTIAIAAIFTVIVLQVINIVKSND